MALARLQLLILGCRVECAIQSKEFVLVFATSREEGSFRTLGGLQHDLVGVPLGTGAGDDLLAIALSQRGSDLIASGDGHKDRDENDEKERTTHLCLREKI